jgi:hypothetical protein
MKLLEWLGKYLLGYKQQRYLKHIRYYNRYKNCVSPENEQCPVCGYYCLGKGGNGCIDKPTLCGYSLK